MKTFLAAIKKSHNLELEAGSFTEAITQMVYQDLKARKVTAEPSLIKFLEELKAHHISLAITSSSVRQSLGRKLKLLGIADYFSVIVSGDDVHEHKPNPASYLVTIERLGVKPDECIVFEDSTAGILAGEAACATVIGFAKYTSDQLHPKSGLAIRDWQEVSYHKLQTLIPKES